MRRSLTRAVVLALALGLAAAAQAADKPNGTLEYGIHHEKYGDIGTHRITFLPNGKELLVEVENRIKVDVLFITAYRFEADRKELWRDGKLVGYDSETHENGRDLSVRAWLQDGKLQIEGPKGPHEAPLGTFPTHPWDPRILEETLVMDTKTGVLRKIAITEVGAETIQARGRAEKARKFQVSGDMNRELWFGEDGTWLQMRFIRRGSLVTFTLK